MKFCVARALIVLLLAASNYAVLLGCSARSTMVPAGGSAASRLTSTQSGLTAKPARATAEFFAIVDEAKIAPTFPTQMSRAPREKTSTTGFDGLTLPWTYFNSRPDQSIAVGPGGILQMVNGGYVALYDRKGHLYPGWPKDAGQFFGLPKGSQFVDHRAVYDTWTKRYWLTSGDYGQPLLYIAVSQSSNPNGKWNVYGFPVAPPNKEWDFDMFGLDRDTVSISTSLVSSNSRVRSSNAVYVIPKAPMESGTGTITGNGFTDILVNGRAPLLIEPVLVNGYAGTSPPGELFLATPDTMPCNGEKHGCREMYAFSIAQGKLTVSLVRTPRIAASPLADTPACRRCLDVSGISMWTGGVYYHGVVYFAFGVGVPNYSTGIPGVFWGELKPRFSGTTLSNASLIEQGTLAFGDRGAFLPSVMVDAGGNFFLVFDSSGPALNPSVYVAGRQPTDPPGKLTSMKLIKRGSAPPPASWIQRKFFPYGDYTAASFDPSSGVWVSSQYSASRTYYGDYVVNVRL